MTAPNSPYTLYSGQTLSRPLVHPVSGQTFLPEGAVLTEHLIHRLRHLGLEREALRCVQAPAMTSAPVPTRAERPEPAAQPPAHERVAPVGDAYDEGLAALLRQAAGSQGPAMTPVMELIKTMIQRMRALELGNFPAIRIFGGGDTAHPLNVTMISLLIGIAMNRSETQLLQLGQAALLHDIGKYGLDPRLVNKTEQLSSAERRVLERHVEFGVDALLGHRASALGLSPGVIATIHAHHERWDGSGYPRGLKRHNIPLDARILSVADVYETMTTDRPYRPRRLAGEAYREILRLSGEWFDPTVVEAFRRVIVPYPNQTLLLLSNGQVGHVIRQGRKPELPVVHLGKGMGVIDLSEPGSPRIVKQLLSRRHPRVAVELPAQITQPGREGAHPGRLHDVSLGGANVATSHALPVGSPLRVAIGRKGEHEIWIPGVVASCAPTSTGPARLGIRFLPLTPMAKAALEEILSSSAASG